VLSEELRQRMRAAVQAERGEAAGQGQKLGTEPERRATAPGTADSDVTSPAVNGVNRAKPERVIKPERTPRSVKSERIARSVKSKRSAASVKLVRPEPAAKPEPAPKPEPARSLPASHKSAGVLRTASSARRGESAREKPVRRHLVAFRLVLLVLVVIAAASLGVAVSRYITTSRSDDSASSAQQHQEAAAREQAAAWVAQQVSHSAIVSCDKAMCAALEEAGFPSRNLRVLGPSTPNPAGSAVVVATATVSDLFGSSLSSYWAPPVLAAIRSGDAEVTIRVVVANEAVAYHADQAAREVAGGDLVKVPGVTVSPTAKNQLITGQVDSRLLIAIAALATNEPIDIVQFGNIGPGVSADVPLRYADLAENGQPAHMTSSAYVRSMRAYLGEVPAVARPASIETVLIGGQTFLRIEFTAPSPLGLLGPSKSP
jgi:hypothetical protein